MLRTKPPRDLTDFIKDMNSARESALISRLDIAKKNIFKLQSGMNSINNTDPLHQKYQEKLLEESETALNIIEKLKNLRKKIKDEKYS